MTSVPSVRPANVIMPSGSVYFAALVSKDALGNPGDIEKVIEQRGHMTSLADDDQSAKFMVLRLQRRLCEKRGGIANGRQGIAQLMRERCQKIVLAPVGVA